MNETSSKFHLSFLTSLGSQDTYVIPRADDELQEDAVSDLMVDVINNGYFGSKKGQPVDAVSAELVTTIIEELE
jgi:hypothetical protein